MKADFKTIALVGKFNTPACTGSLLRLADFLRKRGFSKTEATKIIEKVLIEEHRPPESIFDFVQGITRLARDKTQQDARLDMEGRAKKLLDRAG